MRQQEKYTRNLKKTQKFPEAASFSINVEPSLSPLASSTLRNKFILVFAALTNPNLVIPLVVLSLVGHSGLLTFLYHLTLEWHQLAHSAVSSQQISQETFSGVFDGSGAEINRLALSNRLFSHLCNELFYLRATCTQRVCVLSIMLLVATTTVTHSLTFCQTMTKQTFKASFSLQMLLYNNIIIIISVGTRPL